MEKVEEVEVKEEVGFLGMLDVAEVEVENIQMLI